VARAIEDRLQEVITDAAALDRERVRRGVVVGERSTPVRRWLADPELAPRQRLYLLLLGFAGNTQDAAALEQRLEVASQSGDTTNLGPVLAADLELRGEARMSWIDDKDLRDPQRSSRPTWRPGTTGTRRPNTRS